MTETDACIRQMIVSYPLVEPSFLAAVRDLGLPGGSRGLDAGCGIGLQTVSLARAVGERGHVTGLDRSREFLRHAGEVAAESGLSARVALEEGDVAELPFADGTFDWAWSSCCVGYSAAVDTRRALLEMARVVKPGGTVAVLLWTSQALLPGYPRLEARLDATAAGMAPFLESRGPEGHFLRTLDRLREAGLLETRARAFAASAHAPLSDALRAALIALFEMRWPEVESELAPDEASAYRRLCRPGSPEFILDLPGYFAFFTCSMFWGKVPGGGKENR
jgi:demethylmenaquinone methyltransferase/2-methoxy-6-polyprenyl-1,4-benzoquinol methylase